MVRNWNWKKKFQLEARNNDNGEIMREDWNSHLWSEIGIGIAYFWMVLKDIQSDLPHEGRGQS